MRKSTIILVLVAVLAGIGAGRDAVAKLLWWAGATELALPLITDDSVRGATLYKIRRFSQADATFAEVGRSVTYNRGLSLAMTGDYALSVAYFDAVLFANQYDADARKNRDIVASLVKPVIGDANGHGRIEAILGEAGLTSAAFDPENPEQALISGGPLDGLRRLDRAVDNRTINASETWLETLADAPGTFLAPRLAAEMERRRETGQAAKPEAERW